MLSLIKKYGQTVLNIILLAGLISLSLLHFRFQKKVGYVENAAVLSRTNIGANAGVELQIKMGQYQQEVNKREQEIEVLRGLLEKDESQEAVKNELSAKQQDFDAFAQNVNKNMPRIQADIMQPVYATINRIIGEFGKEHGYHLILGVTPSSGNLVYGDPGADLTTELVEYINSKTEIQNPDKPGK